MASSKQRAAEFLKSWQEQVTRQLSDPDAIRAMLSTMQSFGVPPYDAASARPAPAADVGDDAIGYLARRLARLERAVAKLAASMDAMAAQAKNPARARAGRGAKPVPPRKRAMAQPKRAVAKRAKPAAKKRAAKRKSR